MNNSINPINYINHVSLKSLNNINLKEGPEPQIPQQNITFKGAEALAVYNKYLVNNDLLSKIPILKPIDVPSDINNIQGEKIYNSEGKLVRILANDKNKDLIYYVSKSGDKLESISIYDNDSKEKLAIDYDPEGNLNCVTKPISKNVHYSTYYDKNGEAWCTSKVYTFDDKDSVYLDYDIDDKRYSIHYRDDADGRFRDIYFDRNMNIRSIWEGSKNGTKDTEISFINGIPYQKRTTESKMLLTNPDDGKKGIDLTDMEPHPEYTFNQNKTNSLQGEKKYYSNGQLEKIITKTGKEYIFDLDGNISSIIDGNKTIEFSYSSSDNKLQRKEITENMSDGAKKITTYWSDGEHEVSSQKDNVKREVCYYDNGIMRSYCKSIEGVGVVDRYYDRDGNLTDCWDK